MKISSRLRIIVLLTLVLSNLAIFGIPARLNSNAATPPSPASKTLNDQSSSSPITLSSRRAQAPLIATVDLTKQSSQLPQTNPQPAGLQRKAGASQLSTTTMLSSGTASRGNVSSSNVVPSVGFDGLFYDGTYPPDVSVATGSTYVVETVNSEVGVYTKQGSPVRILDLSQVFVTYDFLFDPKVLYDPASHDFFVTVGDGNTNSVLVAVSPPDNPMTWRVYLLKTTNIPTIDQPISGMSDDKFVVGINDYSGPCPISPCPDKFLGAETFVLNKAQMINGVASLNETIFGPTKTLMSVDPVRSLSSTTTLYLVSTGGSDLGNRDFHFFNMTGVPPGNVTMQSIPLSIATINPTVLAPQPGTSNLIDSGDGPAPGAGDARIQSAAWFKGSLWFTLADGCTPSGDSTNVTRACFRLTQIDTGVSPNIVRQDFDVGIAGLYLFYPALAMDSAGNLGVVYGYSSATNSTCCYPSLAVTGQATSDPRGSYRQPVTIKRGTADEPTNRYGDFFGAAVDPNDPTRLWVAGEYHRISNWSTFIDSMRVKDFGITGVPSYLSLAPGSSKSSALTITSLGGFTGNVSFAATVSPSVSNGPTPTFAPSTLTLTPGSTSTTVFTVSSVSATPVGFYSVNVTGTTGTDIQAVNMTLRVGPDFTISANITAVTLQGGTTSTAPVSITITSLNNLVGAVNLTATINPAGPSLALNPPTVNLTSGSTATSTLTISISTSTLGGTYLLTVTGKSGPVTHSTTVTVNIQDYTISISPASVFIIVGNSANATVTLTSLNGGFAVGLAAVATPAGPTLTLSPPTLTIGSGASGTSILTVSTSSSTPLGNYTVTVTGTSGSHSHSVTVALRVSGDFTISANPTSMFLTNGQSGQSTITLTSIKGFSGSVSLSAFNAITSTVSPTMVLLSPGGMATATLTITGSQFGSFTVSVTGTNSLLSHTASVTVEVGGFVCLASPDPTTFTDCPAASGSVFNGPLTHPATQLRIGVYASGSANVNGFDITLKTNSAVLLPVDADLTGSVFTTNTPIFVKCIGGVAVLGGSCSSTDNADTLHFSVFQFYPFQTSQPFTGLLFTAVYNITGTTGNISIGFQTGCSTTSVDGGVCVTIYDSSGQNNLEQIKTASFANGNIPYVKLTGNPNVMGPVFASTTATATITATSVNGFPTIFDSGQVQFSATGSSTLSFTFNTNPITIPQNQSATATLTVTPTTAGNYTFTIFGTYEVTNMTGCPSKCISTLSSTITLRIIVQDVSISPNPTTLILNGGSSGTSTFTITSLNGLSGRVNLTATVSPLLANGPTAALSVTAITLASGGSATFTLTVSTTSSTTPRFYSVTVKAFTTLGTRTARGVLVQVRGFSISTSPSSLNMTAGTYTVSNVTLTSLNSFSGNVTLTAVASPAGPALSLWPYTISLVAGGSSTSTLSISTGAATPGSYIVTVTGTSGSLVHTANVTVLITGDFSLSSSPTVITVPAGSTGSTTITATSQAGFSGEVYFGPFANIVINATAVNDSSCLAFGLTLDQPLPSHFQIVLPSSVIGASCNGKFNYSMITGVPQLGSNYLEFGVNATMGHWHAKIYVNGVLLANVDTDASHLVHAVFQSGTISSAFPEGWTSTIILSSGGSGNIVVTFTTASTTQPGNYTFTATGTSGGLSHLTSGIIQVVDFSISASPISISFNANSTGTFTVALASLNHFSGAVNLSTSVSNSSITASCSPTSVSLSAGGTGSSTCSLSSLAAGTYTVTITATSGGLSHMATATATVRDFRVSASPTSLTIPRRNSAASLITVTSVNGFSGSVKLSVSILASPNACTPPSDPCIVPNPPTISLSPKSLSLSSGTSATSTLTVSTGSKTTTGSYTIIVTVTSGPLSHTVSISLTVT